MTLLTAVLAAIITTLIWYCKDSKNQMQTGTLCLMYWGASLMWLVDAVAEYVELKEKYFMPAPEDMLHDFFLGISVVTFGLMIWLIILLLKDPKGVLKQMFQNTDLS